MSAVQKTSQFIKTHTTATCSVLLGLIAFLVRIPALKYRYALGPDDGVYGMSAKAVAGGLPPFRDTFSSQGGYFLQIITVPVRLAPNLFVAARLVPIAAGCGIAICAYLIARRIMPENWAFIAGLSCALSGTLIRATGPITSDGVVSCVILICIITTLRFVDQPTLARALIAGTFLGLGAGIKNIFMIPVIIFIIAITFKTSLKLRLLAGVTSIVVFVLPFLVYGPHNVWDQSFLYHMEKHDQRSLSKNVSKIFTTISSFDIVFIALVVLVSVGTLIALIKYRQETTSYARRFFRFPRGKEDNQEHIANYLAFFYFLPAVALMLEQTPLFRNHLAILVPVGYIVLYFYFRILYNKFSLPLRKPVTGVIVTSLFIIAIVATISSYIATISNTTFQQKSGNAQTQELLSSLNDQSIVLTDDPGLVWSSGLNVPRMVTDVSRYRFSSTTESIRLTEKSFSSWVGKDHVCAAVQSPLQNPKLLNIAGWVPSAWEKHTAGSYTVWVNPDQQCRK